MRSFLAGSLVTRWLAWMLTLAFGFPVLGSVAHAEDEKAPVVDLVEKGIQAYKKESYEESASHLRDALAIAPSHSPSLLYLTLAQLKQQKVEEGIRSLREYSAVEPYTELEASSGVRARIPEYLKALEIEKHDVAARAALAAEPGPGDPRSVAVAYFRNDGPALLDPVTKALSALVIDDLALVRGVQVVPRDRMQALLEARGAGTQGKTDNKAAAEIARRLGAGKVVTGDVVDLASLKLDGDKLRVEATVSESATGQVIATQTAEGSLDDIAKLQKTLSVGILAALGYDEARLRAAGVWDRLNLPQTTQLAAIEAFAAGLDAKDERDFSLAREHFDRALAEDPKFGLARSERESMPLVPMSVDDVIAGLLPSAPTMLAATDDLAPAPLTFTEKALIGAGVVAVGVGAGIGISELLKEEKKNGEIEARCGNRVLEPQIGEECDLGDLNGKSAEELGGSVDAGCTANCKVAKCGDRIIQPPEQCDGDGSGACPTLTEGQDRDGNPVEVLQICDACKCIPDPNFPGTGNQPKDCGNGKKDVGEFCDKAVSPSPECPDPLVCEACSRCSGCGDGTQGEDEACDPNDPTSFLADQACESDCKGTCGWRISLDGCTITEGAPPGQDGVISTDTSIAITVHNDCASDDLVLGGVTLTASIPEPARPTACAVGPIAVSTIGPDAGLQVNVPLPCAPGSSATKIEVNAQSATRGGKRIALRAGDVCDEAAGRCGDAVVNNAAGEECDDGNGSNNDACLNTCELARCGDFFVLTGQEECDEGAALNSNLPNALCRDDCTLARCGDGILDPRPSGPRRNEECDGLVRNCPDNNMGCNPPGSGAECACCVWEPKILGCSVNGGTIETVMLGIANGCGGTLPVTRADLKIDAGIQCPTIALAGRRDGFTQVGANQTATADVSIQDLLALCTPAAGTPITFEVTTSFGTIATDVAPASCQP